MFSPSPSSDQQVSVSSFEVGVLPSNLQPVTLDCAYPNPVVLVSGEDRFDLLRTMLLHGVKNSDEVEFFGVDVKHEFADDLKRFSDTVVTVAEDKVSSEDVLKQLVALMYERYAVMDEQHVSFWDDAEVDDQKTTVVFVGLTNEFCSHTPVMELLSKLIRLGKASGITVIMFLHDDALSYLRGEFKSNITTVFVLGETLEDVYSTVMVSDFAYHEALQNYDVLLYQNRAGQGTYPFVRNVYSWEELYRWVEQQNGITEPDLYQELTQ